MKTAAVQIIHRAAYTERLFFLSKPDLATRQALRAAGWRYDLRGAWWRHTGTTTVIKPKDLTPFLTPIAANDNSEQAATA